MSALPSGFVDLIELLVLICLSAFARFACALVVYGCLAAVRHLFRKDVSWHGDR